MYLTKLEERMLSGEMGEAVRIAMKLLVSVGEALGAERLVPIAHAHVSGVSYDNIGRYGLEFLESLAASGARFAVYTTFNPAGVALGVDAPINTPERVAMQARILRALVRMGARFTATCAPYRVRRPRFGEHLAWGESSAVAVANTLFGARTNREGGPVALAAAIAGRTYYWGLHLDEERVPDVRVRLQARVRSELEAGLVGFIVAKHYPSSKPYVDRFPSDERLVISLAAAGAAQGAIPMWFLEGVSPEARPPPPGAEKLEVKRDDLVAALEEVSCANPEDAEVLFLGCPHYTTADLERAATEALAALRGLKRVREVWVAAPPSSAIRLKEALLRALAGRGPRVRVLPGACVVVTDRGRLPAPIATNSVKTAIYLCKSGVPAALVGGAGALDEVKT